MHVGIESDEICVFTNRFFFFFFFFLRDFISKNRIERTKLIERTKEINLTPKMELYKE